MVERLLERLRVDLAGWQDHMSASRPSQPSAPRFLSEQTGDVETYLKSVWSEFFLARPDVALAYLVSVRFDSEDLPAVALCLRTTTADRGTRDTLVAFISTVFQNMFDPEESLSVIFLSTDQVPEIEMVARPFYSSALHDAPIRHAAVLGHAPRSEGQSLAPFNG